MRKYFMSIGVKVMLYSVLTAIGIWFYLGYQEPTLINKILFGVFGGSMVISCTIDIKKAFDRFINESGK